MVVGKFCVKIVLTLMHVLKWKIHTKLVALTFVLDKIFSTYNIKMIFSYCKRTCFLLTTDIMKCGSFGIL